MPAGLQDNRARLYAPKLMRFISEDPIGFEGGYNLYEYAAGDPVDYKDPNGTNPILLACAGEGLINATAGTLLGRKHTAGDFARGFAKGCAQGLIGFGIGWMGVRGWRLLRGSVDDVAEGVVTACRFNSFVPGTRVLMADGSSKPIEQVAIGDLVLASEPETGMTRAERVTDVIEGTGRKRLVRIAVDTDGKAGGPTEALTATDEHPFWLDDGRGWVDARDIDPGDHLRTPDGHGLVTDVVASQASGHVYNLTVANAHTYYVLAGQTPVLVHNAGCDEWAEVFAKKSGGEIKSFSVVGPDGSPISLGPYRPGGPGTPELQETWFHHTVVVRGRKVYDQWHQNGIGIDEYKRRFDYWKYIDFGF